jgi:SpoVK/Ycf46/Vps4 family AAA+-type ATPase
MKRRFAGTASNQVRWWVAKVMDTFSLARKFVGDGGFESDEVAELLEVCDMRDRIYDDCSGVVAAVEARCRGILAEKAPRYPENLVRNVARIRTLVDLGDTECELLRFATLLHTSRALDDACESLGIVGSAEVPRVMARLLDEEEGKIRRAFSPRSPLALSGLLELDRYDAQYLRGKLELPSRNFADMLLNYEGDDLYELFKEVVRCVVGTPLRPQDYDYMANERELLLRYLRKSLETGDRGANVLLYGFPGSGKTELVKVLADELGVELFEISYADEDDEPMEGRYRIKAYKNAQYLFARRPVVLLFDEVEDVFEDLDPTPALMGFRPSQKHKGWMNRMLENARVPTVWVSNSVETMDAAVLRRFDIVLEMPLPPRSVRRRIAREAFGSRLSERGLETLAAHRSVSPAILTRAAAVLRKVDAEGQMAERYAHTLVSGTLEAQGHRPLEKMGRSRQMAYDPAFVNADADLQALAEGIAAHSEARLCLYGPPGTGKSAFGRWLAERLDRPFLLKKGSDLLSMYVGGTEANIAAAFEEAEREDAVLVFDEVDGFLQDRREARHSWEVTQVNELLTQMESFDGIFIATTNLMENLDQASLRRFDLKVKFGYMRPEQCAAMFRRLCRELGLNEEEEAALRLVETLETLTPGDFAALMRQHRFRPLRNAGELAERLEEACMAKKVRVNGFVVGFDI